MSFPGLELPTRLKHMLPVTTEAWHFSSSWKGLRREVDGASAKDTAWGPCQGYCRHWGGWKLQGQDSKASRFCHSLFDARFLVYSFRREIQSPEFCSESWWPSEMPPAAGTDDPVLITAQAWELCLSLPWETESLVTSHIVASTMFIFCKLNVRHFLF